MSADSAVTYTSVHSEARSWSIPSEDPYEEAARQLLEQAPRSPEYVPDPIELEDHVPVYIPEPEHPEDLVPAEDEAPTPPLPPSFLSPRIRPPRTRAAMAQMRATTPSTYHPLLPSGTPPLLPIPLPAPSTSRRADIPEADTPPRKRLLLTTLTVALINQGVAAANGFEAEASRVEMATPSMALRESSDSLDGLRNGSLCLALAIAQHLVKSNLRLALYKTMLLHGGTPIKTTTPKQLHALPWAITKENEWTNK
ncbi:hypothetical protein Tco_0422442 [Tanacetum coccineum]